MRIRVDREERQDLEVILRNYDENDIALVNQKKFMIKKVIIIIINVRRSRPN